MLRITRRDFISSALASASFLALNRAGLLADTKTPDPSGKKGLELKENLIRIMKDSGAYEVRIANPRRGFEHSAYERQVLTLWPECRSLIIVITPNPPAETFIPENERNEKSLKDIGDEVSPSNTRINAINPLVRPVMSKALPAGGRYLERQGFTVKNGVKNGKDLLEYKLCAYEAGIGVYGRSGLILHPTLGNRICIMVLMTDAKLPPDEKVKPVVNCDTCGICVRSCPAKAYDINKKYPSSYSLITCATNRNNTLLTKGTLCQSCFQSCVASKKTDKELETWLKDKAAELTKKAKDDPETRIQEKVERFRKLFDQWQATGRDIAPIVKIMERFEPLMKQDKLKEAEDLLDQALKIIGE